MQRLLIVAPNWVGDAVLATPTLRAIREGLPESHITLLARQNPADVLAGAPWFDDLVVWPMNGRGKRLGVWKTGRQLKSRANPDAAVLMPNSFRSVMLAVLSGARKRVGYTRDGRTVLLTHRLEPLKQGRDFVPESMLVYYARLADAIGCPVRDNRLELFTSEQDRQAVDQLLERVGPSRPLIVFNPGGAFGPSKYWPAGRFGQLGDRLIERFGGSVVVSGAPSEKAIVDQVAGAMKRPVTRLTDSPIPLSAMKELVRRADLLVTNDTGPRHFALAMGTPVVTLFGSTDPAWTETHADGERSVRIEMDCSPCQKPVCPLGHHDCMQKMSVEMVEAEAASLLQK